jgi:hypothetical protein
VLGSLVTSNRGSKMLSSICVTHAATRYSTSSVTLGHTRERARHAVGEGKGEVEFRHVNTVVCMPIKGHQAQHVGK